MKKKELFKDLSDEQAEKVVGGVGRVLDGGPGTGAGAGVNGWGAGGTPSEGHGLLSAGFSGPPGANPNVAAAGVVVKIPGSPG